VHSGELLAAEMFFYHFSI